MQSQASPSVAPSEDHRWLLPLVAVVAVAVVLVAAIAAFAASNNSGDYGWMMGGNWSWMWGVGAVMMLMPLIFLVLLIALLLRPAVPPTTVVMAPASSNPFTEVQIRYARGEITPDQYRQVVNDLRAAR